MTFFFHLVHLIKDDLNLQLKCYVISASSEVDGARSVMLINKQTKVTVLHNKFIKPYYHSPVKSLQLIGDVWYFP